MLAAPSATAHSVQFTPQITVPGNYALYAYVPTVDSAATQMHYIVYKGKTANNVFIKTHVRVEGQTSGEWVSPGTYALPQGTKATVTITTKNANGYVVADAILFVPVK